MSFLRYAIGANYRRFFDRLQTVSAQAGKSRARLSADFLACFFSYGCGLSDYLGYELWDKTSQERREYVTIKDQDQFYERVSPSKYKTFFTVKPNFLQNFSAYINRGFYVPNEGNLPAMEEFLCGRDAVMVKPVDGLGGHGVHIQKVSEIGDHTAFHQKLLAERLFLEELIVQHPEMAQLCPSSVNTIRIMTVNTGKQAEIFFAGLRVGAAGADVDNFHAGGMAVLVDPETGVLQSDAINKSGQWFSSHPDTGISFQGRKLPMWDQVRRICLEASFVNSNIHVVGWDVAITPDGPTFVEGNRRPGFDLPQMVSRRGRKDLIRMVDKLLSQEA